MNITIIAMKRNRWGSYEDYAREIDEEAERKTHVEQQCDPAYCIHCQTEREIDDMVEYLDKQTNK